MSEAPPSYGWTSVSASVHLTAEEWAKYTPDQQRLLLREVDALNHFGAPPMALDDPDDA